MSNSTDDEPILGVHYDAKELNQMVESMLPAWKEITKEEQAVNKIGDPCPECNHPLIESRITGITIPGFYPAVLCQQCYKSWVVDDGQFQPLEDVATFKK